jgi:DNA-binding response OmpR family regulator
MKWNPDLIRNRLKNRRVLLVEDDKDLAPRLEHVFAECGARVVARRCVIGESEGALNLLLQETDPFDLVCVDIMLPLTETDLKECDGLQQEWDELQKEISKVRRSYRDEDFSGKARQEVEDLRKKLDELDRAMRGKINREAGMNMIQQWCDRKRQKCGITWTPSAGILFLTARQALSLADRVKEIKVDTKWIIKPSSVEQILEAAAELLMQKQG